MTKEKQKRKLTLESPILFICDHLIGEQHKPVHRRIIGFIVAVCGVALATISHEYCHVKIIAGAGDFVGYLMHAAGVIPILKRYGIG
jgi:hypothetical protein